MSNNNDIYEIQKLPKQISVNHAEQSIEKMQVYGGHSAYTKLYHYDGRVLESINLVGYVMFRSPSTYGHWGFVIKASDGDVYLPR